MQTLYAEGWSTSISLDHEVVDGQTQPVWAAIGRLTYPVAQRSCAWANQAVWAAIGLLSYTGGKWSIEHKTPQEADWVGYTRAHLQDPGSIPGGGSTVRSLSTFVTLLVKALFLT